MGIFAGQIAVVTGASSGIGEAVALGLGTQGATLCLVGRNFESLERVARCARATASQVACYRADLTMDEDIQNLTVCLRKDFSRIDLLIHSAGAISWGRLESAPIADFDLQYRTNVRAPYLLTQTLLPMLRPHRGQIVFINSSLGLRARHNVGQYAATKHALKAIADSLREEVSAEGFRVLSIFLGSTATPMQKAACEKESRAYHPEQLLQPENVAAVVINALSLPPTGAVSNISINGTYGELL